MTLAAQETDPILPLESEHTTYTNADETNPRTCELFADEDADIILCSSDQIRFRVHKWPLIRCSAFFKDMFSLKQVDNNLVPSTTLHEIPMPEHSSVLELLLRFIYPVPPPPIESFDTLSQILEIAVKYDVLVAIEIIKAHMLQPRFLEANYPGAVALYASSVRYGFEDVAKQALKAAISRPLLNVSTPPSQVRHISGADYHRLLYCQRQRADRAREILGNSDLRFGNLLSWVCDTCNAYGCSWWKPYKDAAFRALGDRPISDALWNKTIIEEALFRGCEKRYFYFGRAVELCYFDTLKAKVDALPYE